LISIDLDNGLIAQSELGTLALIDKKDFGGVSITINPGPGGQPDMPEPTSVVLACLGCLALLGCGILQDSGLSADQTIVSRGR